MSGSYPQLWFPAARSEFDSLMAHGTFDLVPLSEVRARGRRPIGCRWLFKVKYLDTGVVDKLKARLVGQGCTQQAGIDFHSTFAPTLKYKSLRALLSLAATLDWEVKQMDVQTAFLNGDMKEEVYMRLPEGVEVTTGDGEPQLVFTPESASRGGRGGGGVASEGEWALRLRKALYGTKQASNVWHESIDSFLRSLGYRP